MATPIHVIVDLKDVWGVNAVRVITDDGAEHPVPMTSTMHRCAVQVAAVALGLFGQPQPATYDYGRASGLEPDESGAAADDAPAV